MTSKAENNCQNQVTTSPTPATFKTRRAESSPVMHPNNPYIPWTPEMRREVLRPLAAPDDNSNACGSSHTVLELVPASSSIGHRPNGVLSKRMKLPASLKILTNLVSKNFKQVAKRMSNSKDGAPMLDISEVNFSSYCLLSSSFEPKDETTLSAWLSDRQREQFECEKLLPTGMTLDEYEEWGSWTHLPQSVLIKVDQFALLDGSPSSRKSRSESFLESRPQSASSHSPRSSSLNRGSLRGTLSARDRTMPGGWTFG